ncbi:MAG: family ATPase [Bacteroidetes bacterium]|nr:family ATPase [Bacteroidota bacterium]
MQTIKGLASDFEWLQNNLEAIIEKGIQNIEPAPELSGTDDAYAKYVNVHSLDVNERLLILLSLSQYLDSTLLKKLVRDDNDFRLVQCPKTGVLLPTGETFLTLVSQNSLQNRMEAHRYLGTDHLFYRKSVLSMGEATSDASAYYGVLNLTASFRELFLYNRHSSPRFNKEFPAHLLETHLNWDDLIINPVTAERLEEIKAFLDHGETLRKKWGLSKHMKQGYRCLFYGPSGTGKTLAATLLGKHVQREVYRVDLSTVISKYIGETSKNLNALFNTAEDKDWILFFDEGDALFGKRVDTAQSDNTNAHFANQDIAFLLQRIENYNGLIIVASNFKKNMDDAFSRRFQSIVHFDVLNADLRKQYWEDNLPTAVSLGTGIDLEQIAKKHPLSPASIINIINRVSLQTIRKNKTEIGSADLELCIKDELIK